MKRILVFLMAGLAVYAPAMLAVPQQINYQGNLTRTNGSPLDTTVAMTFVIFNGPNFGATAMWSETQSAVVVQNGVFHVLLGSVTAFPSSLFDSTSLWLGLAVGGDGEMSPRVQVMSDAYSQRVQTVNGASGGTISSDLHITNRLNVGSGNTNEGNFAFVAGQNNHARGDHDVIGGGAYNRSSGLYNVIAGGGGFGEADSNSCISSIYSAIGGGQQNSISGCSDGVIAGGSRNQLSGNSWSTIGGGLLNNALGNNSTIGGGTVNTAAGGVSTIGGGDHNYTAGIGYATVSGGQSDSASGIYATVSGGYGNVASGGAATISGGGSNSASGYGASVSGGNSNVASNTWATVSGGVANAASGFMGTVGGGGDNYARGTSSVVAGGGSNSAADSNSALGTACTIGGGVRNLASIDYSTVAGGDSNLATGYSATIGGGTYNAASDSFGTVSGGFNNTALSAYSTTGGGQNNHANGINSVVPGGLSNTASGTNSFAAGQHASAGTGSFCWGSSSTGSTTSAGNYQVFFRCQGGAAFLTTSSGTTVGVGLAPGGGAWGSLSDSTKKRNRRNVDTKAILKEVEETPIQQWSYKSQDPSIEHIGPMAQDFWREFHIGDDSLTISTIDPSGIALAAIQELAKENSNLESRNLKLEETVAKLQVQVQSLLADKRQASNQSPVDK